MSDVIVAVVTDPKPWQFGLVYFDESEWPRAGYTFIRRVTGCTRDELLTMMREHDRT